jgi:hypothetical protein
LVRYIADDAEEEARTLQEPPPAAYLVLLIKGKVSQSFPLREEIQLGRERGNAVVVADQKVSRQHARLTPIDNTFIVTDLGSANGTYVNGVKINQPTRLQNNDRLGIGDTTFIFTVTQPEPDTAYLPLTPPLPPASRVAPPFPLASPKRGIWSLEAGQFGPLWSLLGCLVLLILALLLLLAMLLGVVVGRSEILGLALLWLA